MHTVTSFHSSSVQPRQVSAIMADYLALERARIFRRLFVKRFGVLALIAAVAGHWLSAFAAWFTVSLCLVAPVSAWMVELRRARRLARRLDDIPGSTTHVVDVRKS